jgi:hypothetical protein
MNTFSGQYVPANQSSQGGVGGSVTAESSSATPRRVWRTASGWRWTESHWPRAGFRSPRAGSGWLSPEKLWPRAEFRPPRAAAFGSTQISKDYAAAAQSAFAGITKYDTTTDFQGNGSFKNVPPGKYYLFGYTEIRKNFISWHIEVEVKDADQKLVLDTNNSLP